VCVSQVGLDRRSQPLCLPGIEHSGYRCRSRPHDLYFTAYLSRGHQTLSPSHKASRQSSHPASVATRYFRRDGEEHVVCELCPRFCRLREGQRGLCFVRACQDGRIVLTSYGRSTGFCVDPIEKKPLYHFLPGTPVLSFATAGCNLACKFCQNWRAPARAKWRACARPPSPGEIAEAAQRHGCPQRGHDLQRSKWCFHEYAIDVADACHERGIKTVAVTAGYVCPAPRAEFYRRIDAANVDLKAFTDRFYRELCAGDLATVLDTLVFLREQTKVWLEVTTLLIPGENDSDGELDQMTRWMHDQPRADCAATLFGLSRRLSHARQTAHITRNPDPRTPHRDRQWLALRVHRQRARRDRRQHELRELRHRLVGRDCYEITAWNLTDGRSLHRLRRRVPRCLLPAPLAAGAIAGFRWTDEITR